MQLNTLISSRVERIFENIQTELRRRGISKRKTSKRAIIETLVEMPDVIEYLEETLILQKL